MYEYSLTKWILCFFIYCFLGWIWESIFVSIKHLKHNKKWEFVNRGFLQGPCLPIYGFAAIAILLVTSNVNQSVRKIYLVGTITATVFELITGTAMEKMFKVKYWDYSCLPCNYNGHISIFTSLGWGFLSVVLVMFMHPPIEKIILQMSDFISEIIAFSLTIVFAYDVHNSLDEAMDLRELLVSFTDDNNMLHRLEHRFNAWVAFSPKPDIGYMKENTKENLIYNIEKFLWFTEMRIEKLKERIENSKEEIPDHDELIQKLQFRKRNLMKKTNKQFMGAINQIKRNPGMSSKRYQEILEMLKTLKSRKD